MARDSKVYREDGKEDGNYYILEYIFFYMYIMLYRGYIGIMGKNMETTILYWGVYI